MLTCIDATKTGDITHTGKLWTYDGIDRSISTVAIADGLLYVADVAGRCIASTPRPASCYWVYDTEAEIWGSHAGGRRQNLLGHPESALGLRGRQRTSVSSARSVWDRPDLRYPRCRQRFALCRLAEIFVGNRTVETSHQTPAGQDSRASAHLECKPDEYSWCDSLLPPGKRKTGSRP